MKKITNEIIRESIDKNMNTFRKKALSGKVSGQDVAELFGYGELYETEETMDNDDDIKPLLECWRQKYLMLEGKYYTSMENPDDYKTDKTFKDVDEYEEWMKEREKLTMAMGDEDDEENEEDNDDEEINLIEKSKELKEKLVSTLEKIISDKEQYEELEIKDSIQLLLSIEPEKVSEEDIELIKDETDKNIENSEENEKI
jgi:hypothetical protein